MQSMLRVAALIATALVVANVRADEPKEEKLSLDKLPKAVQETVKKRFPAGEFVGAAKEEEKTKDGAKKVEFEVTIKDGGAKIDVMLTPEGRITVIEKQIAAKDLPKAVTETLNGKHPKAELKTVEEVFKVTDGEEALDFYEVLLVTAEKKTVEVKLTSDGRIKGTETKLERKRDKEEKEDKDDK